jgi:hypothetical protein
MKQTKQTEMPAAVPAQPATRPPTVAPTEMDPLRVQSVYCMEETRPQEAKALRARLLEQIIQSLPRMDTTSVQSVAQFMDLCQNDRGCVTPAESFITDLVSDHYLHGGLTPETVMHEFDGNCDGFKTNYEESLESVQRFNMAYAKPAAA